MRRRKREEEKEAQSFLWFGCDRGSGEKKAPDGLALIFLPIYGAEDLYRIIVVMQFRCHDTTGLSFKARNYTYKVHASEGFERSWAARFRSENAPHTDPKDATLCSTNKRQPYVQVHGISPCLSQRNP